jgi:dihydrofolate reductase
VATVDADDLHDAEPAMRVCLVVAMARNHVIGQDGGLPWHISADLRRFKRITMGKPVVMGRKTFESIGRPLPGRHNIVVTRDPDYRNEGIAVASDLGSALKAAARFNRTSGEREIMVIGGGEIYRQALPLAERVYMTEVSAEPEGDAVFPALSESDWIEVAREEHEGQEDGADHPYSFIVLDRRPCGPT